VNKYQTYRPEIDGLRAISVLAVIFYHADIVILENLFFKGGFIGVDIFFVISGYLITKIILSELKKTGQFSFINFYRRRARRILPILFFVMLISFPFVFNYVIPNFFIEYSKSIISSLFFISNLYFWDLGVGYDQLQSIQFQPFLHTWSLSVEEQFYVLFPISLIFVFKYLKKYLNVILISFFILSLGLADYMSATHASINFYSLPTRGWELLAGSLLASLELKGKKKFNNLLVTIFTIIGLILIFYSFLFYDDRMLLPSLLSLPAVLGVCLIIWFSDKNCLVTRILSGKLFVGVGLISYSLYVWHYPIFIIFDNVHKIQLIILTFILSILSYFFIEKPFRNRSKNSSIYSITTLVVISAILLILNSFTIYNKGFYDPSRYPKMINEIILEKNSEENLGSVKKNIINNKKNNIYIAGDSHMVLLHALLKEEKKISNYNLIPLNASGCYYIHGFDKIHKGKKNPEKDCDQNFQDKRKKEFLSKKDSIVIIGGRLPVYMSGKRYDNGEGGREQKEWYIFKNSKDRKLTEGIQNSIKDLLEAGVKVVLIYPIPPVGFDIMKKLFDYYKWNKENFEQYLKLNPITTSNKNFLNWSKTAKETLDGIKHQNLYKIYPQNLFCNTIVKDRCALYDESDIFYLDNNHLSKAGNKKLINLIIQKINLIEKNNN
jgi:peptidoglycan/LPS O-acetylase OafA/YrhL